MPRILVIDDDAAVRTFFEEVLGRASYEVATAEDGDRGLECFHETPADLVIVDVLLPGKGGLETILELQHQFPDLKVIAMSGGFQKRTDQDRALAETLGVHRTLAKPLTAEELLRAVQETLGG